jgi:MFS family permease
VLGNSPSKYFPSRKKKDLKMTEKSSPKNPMARVMAVHDFRLLFTGATTSLLGDQFALIATPWLVLRLTGDPLVLGFVLALEGIPRAVFMLLGGAVTDRISPRLLMFLSDAVRLALTVWMAFAVFTGTVQMWMLYVFGLGFGLVAGFAIPAENSIVPMLVEERDLQAGNSIIMGISQLVGFIGPTVAGILIGGFSRSLTGIGMAFALDAISFAVSGTCLWLMRGGSRRERSAGSSESESIWVSIAAGVKYLWSDRVLRLMFLVITALNFLIVGPLLVGIPVLANQRFSGSAVVFGMLMSAYAGGNLVGYLLAGSLPRPAGNTMRVLIILLQTAFGLVIASFGFSPFVWLDFSLMLLTGVGNGYISIIMFTWMQTRTPREMLGRMMSILMFSNTGLVPIAQAISGAVSKWNLTALFGLSGALILLLTLWTAFQPGLRAFSESLSAKPAEEPILKRSGEEPSVG